ncbi:bifunctional DNA primase/polymerase [Sulfoacidibacillus thermotolerans]|uniref:DNA primase/polymerase bifunctional N-terminal domain-containing protein n=1 Tax=Sulfoacidibacillus thermotolerans TaxID=1765684 RepID=A0A2U3D440_SULT2|nr:bifunctional DNA primase/polymerase [Sulfoacidibacillus thermotolerans]PWI56060.1 hypothetical protein BM613_13230 [Sulfoacidibacillus thermotolerans]
MDTHSHPITLPEPFLSYASLGWRIFPLHSITEEGKCTCRNEACPNKGKHPIIKGWREAATSDSEQIAAWLSQYPFANWGLATGVGSGVVAIDIDPRHNGDESLIKLESDLGIDLSETVTSLTGGGGQHYLFATCESYANTTRFRGLDGIDVRADGGYIVIPPSLHHSGRRYEWDVAHDPADMVPAPLPISLAAALKPKESESILNSPMQKWDDLPLDVARELPKVCWWMTDVAKRYAQGEKRVVSYEEWITGASWFHAATPSSSELFHEWSALDQEQYRHANTERKWRDTANLSPRSCGYVAQNHAVCAACPIRHEAENPVAYLRKRYGEELGLRKPFGVPSFAKQFKSELLSLDPEKTTEKIMEEKSMIEKMIVEEPEEFQELIDGLEGSEFEEIRAGLLAVREEFERFCEGVRSFQENHAQKKETTESHENEIVATETLRAAIQAAEEGDQFALVRKETLLALAMLDEPGNEEFYVYSTRLKEIAKSTGLGIRPFERAYKAVRDEYQKEKRDAQVEQQRIEEEAWLREREAQQEEERKRAREEKKARGEYSESVFEGVPMPPKYSWNPKKQQVELEIEEKDGMIKYVVIARFKIGIRRIFTPVKNQENDRIVHIAELVHDTGMGLHAIQLPTSALIDYKQFVDYTKDIVKLRRADVDGVMDYLNLAAVTLTNYANLPNLYGYYIDKHGWIKLPSGKWAYYTGRELVGTEFQATYISGMTKGDPNVARTLHVRRGSIAEMTEHIRNDLVSEPEIAAFISFAVGSPLIRALHDANLIAVKGFLVELVGSKSSTGKSTAAKMAGYLFGGGIELSNLTFAALSQMMYESGGVPVILDEPQASAKNGGRKNSAEMREIIFNISAGRDKARGSASGKNRDVVEFTGLFMMTANESYVDLVNDEPGDGEMMRLISLAPSGVQGTDRAEKMSDIAMRWSANAGIYHEALAKQYVRYANDTSMLTERYGYFTKALVERIRWAAGTEWEESRMGTVRRYASHLAVAVLGAAVLEDAVNANTPVSDEPFDPDERPFQLRDMVMDHLAQLVWQQISEGERFRSVSLRASDYIDEVIATRGEREIRSHNPESPTLPPPTGWLGFWVDAEHTKVAFYPTKFDDLLRERGYGANVVRKALIEEGRIENDGKHNTMVKRDIESKKPIRVIIYKPT